MYWGDTVPQPPLTSKIKIVDYHGGFGGILPPDGGLGAEPPMGVQGATPLPLIVLIKICTSPTVHKSKKFLKKYNFKKIIFWGNAPQQLT